MSFELDPDILLKYLNTQDLEPTFQTETGQIYVLMRIKEVSVPIFFGVNRESSLLQVLAYLPYQLQESAVGEAARMLHILNKELDMPGFGMDEKEKLMFYRCMIPCPGNKVNGELLGMYVATTRYACDTFMYVIGAIASGTIKTEDYINKKNG